MQIKSSFKQLSGLTLLCLLLSACVAPQPFEKTSVSAQDSGTAFLPILQELEQLPPPQYRIPVAVYKFPDLTGAFKSNENFAVYSKAVPQGAETMVIEALMKAGNGRWFNVIERQGLSSLIQERQIYEVGQNKVAEMVKNREMAVSVFENVLRQSGQNPNVSVSPGQGQGLELDPKNQVALQQMGMKNADLDPLNKKDDKASSKDEKSSNKIPASGSVIASAPAQVAPSPVSMPSGMPSLPILNTAAYIIEGGIVGYDSDVVTGGVGAKFMNIGGFGDIRKDVVAINMRVISVKTGNVVLSTTMTKGIYSQKLQGSGIGYVTIDKILQAEAGIAYNDPVFEALNVTVQSAVVDLVRKGKEIGLWS